MAFNYKDNEWEVVCDRCGMSSSIDCGDAYSNLGELETDLIVAGWDIGSDEQLCSDCSLD